MLWDDHQVSADIVFSDTALFDAPLRVAGSLKGLKNGAIEIIMHVKTI